MRSRRVWIITALVTVVALGLAGGGAYFLLRTKGAPAQTAGRFLNAWQEGDHASMRAVTVSAPSDFEQRYKAVRQSLGVTKVQTDMGRVVKNGDRATAPFTVTATLPEGTWRYQGSLRLVTNERKWKVSWGPEAIHPDLRADRQIKVSYAWPRRGRVLAADGTAIDGTAVPGSVQQLVGAVAPATDKQAERLGTPYRKGDTVGQSGIQARYEKRLAGRPAAKIVVTDASGRAVKSVGSFPARPGSDVKTSLDLRVERAAVNAVLGQTKPTSLLAMRPSTGEILAVANLPGGFDRAMAGIYPPGSTFKVVTAYALLRKGLTAGSKVSCPKSVDISGQPIRNSEGEELGTITFKDAVAHSCNTVFAAQTTRRLSPAELASTAATFGFNQKIDPGVTVRAGSFPTPTSDAELAMAGFGQGRDLANTLNMAGVAAAVGDGTWRPPVLVTEPAVRQKAKATRLDPGARSQLAGMMRAVVTSGTARPAGLPAGTAGKTGTAEYGTGKKPPTHAWFMGYRGDVAFAVVVEGGGFGAKRAAPIAARFLKAL